MEKNLFLILIVLPLILIIGCSCENKDLESNLDEDALYQEKVKEFFDELKNNNVYGVKSLFSKNTIENDLNLEVSINELINFYSEDNNEFLFTSCASEKTVENGKEKVKLSSVFPLINNNSYYWIYLSFVYIDEFDSLNVGINQINFYTSDEYCIFYHSDNKLVEDTGLNLYIEKELKEEVVCINKYPYKYKTTEYKLDFSDVDEFLKNNNDINKFILTFGDYNCYNKNLTSFYYDVLYNDETLYLELNCKDNQIIEASLYNDREFIKKVL